MFTSTAGSIRLRVFASHRACKNSSLIEEVCYGSESANAGSYPAAAAPAAQYAGCAGCGIRFGAYDNRNGPESRRIVMLSGRLDYRTDLLLDRKREQVRTFSRYAVNNFVGRGDCDGFCSAGRPFGVFSLHRPLDSYDDKSL